MLLKKIIRTLLRLAFRVEINGLENFKNAGERVLIIANHVSFLDPPLLWAFLPDHITFAINTQIAEKPWIRPFLRFSNVFEMDPTQPLSLKNLINHLRQNEKAVIFPEGRITTTGTLMKIYDGTGMVAERAHATILPIRIQGAEYSFFSRFLEVPKKRFFPKIRITVLPPTRLNIPENIHGKERRHASGQALKNIMTDMMFNSSQYHQTIFGALLQARQTYGGKHQVVDDVSHQPQDYNNLITRTLIIGNLLQTITIPGENVGVFLPSSGKTLNVVLGIQTKGRTPAMLNFSTGAVGMISACQTAKIKTVLTSRRFIELGNLQEDADMLQQQVNLVYLEDLAKKVTLLDKLKGLIQAKTTHWWYQETDPNEPAVILFTSGSEGAPKGVVLSHTNILANHKQLQARIDFTPKDLVLNVLPMFHSFGFCTGTLFPILNGLQIYLYPTPLHFSVIPEIAYEKNATILFSTNTFLAAYGKKAHPYDFYRIRYVFAGAEKLHANTRQLWSEKFGIRILEGYGVTETSPIISLNTPIDCKADTVGQMIPAMQYRIEEIPGLENAGQLHVKGPNVMKGYLLADKPGELTPPVSKYGPGWYNTGDIVHIDSEGFISIRGRCKRFAKISGEMISLTAVEQLVSKVWPDAHHAVISMPDPKKGEQLILVTTQKDATSQYLLANSKGVSAINLPRKILVLVELPLLATGKTAYPEVTKLVVEKL